MIKDVKFLDSGRNMSVKGRYRLIFCNDELMVKGDYEITGYGNDVIMLRCADDKICIRGIEMKIIMLNADEICISGKLADISFNYREDFN